MDLAERLRRLGYTPTQPPAAVQAPRRGMPLEAALRGEWRDTSLGRCYVGRSAYPVDHEHGGVRLGGVFEVEPSALALLGRERGFAGIDFRRTAFLDTETTGLAGGTGTYVFLVGIGYFRDDEFVVEQYFMDDYGQERAMLAVLGETLREFETLVTFNGRVFDWPLLQTRYAMARQRLPLDEPLHLDLLFPARRMWRERVGSCALSSLEENVLGVERTLDLPGWLIPSVYFDYVRQRDAAPLRPVFAHNEQDILSLLALTVRLGRQFSEPLSNEHAVDLYSAGRIFEGAEAWDRAIICYEQALSGDLPSALREQASCRLGLAYKRLRRTANAAEVWRALVGRDGAAGLLPYVELAKHLEHRERAFPEALAVVDKALEALGLRVVNPWQADPNLRHRNDLQRRRKRLLSKIERDGAGSGV